VPLVFLAHQAPLLPLVRRFRRIDGVALLVGSMAPDFAYALLGTRWQLWAHAFPGLATFCVPATLGVAWIVVRVWAPVVPAHLPELGAFHLRDYRALAAHEFGWGRAALWAFLGALSHAGLDHLGHGWGWPAQHFAAYREPLGWKPFLGRPWTVHRLVQYAGHLLLTPLAVGLLWRYGRERWLADVAARVPEFRTSSRSHACLWGATLLGTLAAVLWVRADSRHGGAVILRLAFGVFVGLSVGAVLARLCCGPARR
jgi:uncharacterized protein DUF4184